MTFTIARTRDGARAAAILALTHDAFRDLPIDPPSGVLRETEADFAQRIAETTCFVVEADGELIASVFCETRERGLYFGRLAVRADWRRRGVATAVIAAVKVEARRIGAKRLLLSARILLPSNVKLFQGEGFVITETHAHEGYDEPTFYDMELEL